MAEVDKQLILQSVGPVQAILDAHDGVVNVVDTTDGIIMISLEGGCTGCSSTPMTAMQIYYSLMPVQIRLVLGHQVHQTYSMLSMQLMLLLVYQ